MVGRSNEITGPYSDRNNVLMTSGGGHVVIEGDERWRGPGHCAVLPDGEESWLVHHAYDARANGVPTLRIEKLIWNEENWPVVDNAMPVGGEKQSSIPNAFVLYQNYPNPFNPTTNISFYIEKPTNVVFEIYDLAGKPIKTVIDNKKVNGVFKTKWDGTDNFGQFIPSGIYICTLKTEQHRISKKITLIR